MIERILIANRGEIACRIINTAAKMGIETSVVYSKEDQGSLAVNKADKAFFLSDVNNKNQEYLDIEQIISIAKKNKIDAIHPGYGFLSENALFAKAVEKNDMKFIGPPAEAIKIMGDKIVSKLQAKNCGVSTIPGVDSETVNLSEAKSIAKKIGFPIMVKASAGGGGKGMRVVYNEKDLADNFQSAKNEAKSSFGDERIFIEKFIENPHHIEIQILGDKFGNFIHLGERDCSIQRRNQKIIEEAPSPFIDSAIRDAMAAQAIKLAKSVNYFSAGTIEFIVDSRKNFYFLEMNTRLQVEHPVTELITKVDIVEQMIRIASGEALKFDQAEISFAGCAIETRVYAEDPSRDFMPSVGRLTQYSPPNEIIDEKKEVRNDTGVCEGSNISFKYDPMISKLCVWAPNRKKSLELISHALAEFRIDGIKSNLSFLIDVISKEKFQKGDFTTNFLSEEYPEGFQNRNLSKKDLEYLGAALLSLKKFFEAGHRPQINSLSNTIKENLEDYFIHWNERIIPLSWSFSDGLHRVKNQKQKEFIVKINKLSFNKITRIKVNSKILNLWLKKKTDGFFVNWEGYEGELQIYPIEISKMLGFLPTKKVLVSDRVLSAPMPGLLVSLDIDAGDEVQLGQRLCALEAMKMENVLYAERNGKIKLVHCKKGDILSDGDKILEYE